MKVKTAELIGLALDWAVCVIDEESGYVLLKNRNMQENIERYHEHYSQYRYTSDWSIAGPIIEREEISTWLNPEDNVWSGATKKWISMDLIEDLSYFVDSVEMQKGETPLLATMRCYVASKLSEEVEVPDELLQTK